MIETGIVTAISTAPEFGQISADKGGVLAFDADNVIVGRFSELSIGSPVWFTREEVRGPFPRPLQVRTSAPVVAEPVVGHDHDDEA